MKGMLERLWYACFAEECATIDTEEERMLAKKAIEKSAEANALLSKEQSKAVEKHIEVLFELQEALIKKAFFKGCELAASFLLEVFTREKN